MSRSSFTINFEQRFKINQLKKELEQKLGRRVFDQDFMDILLDTFEKHQHKTLLDEAYKVLECVKELVVSIEDIEKIREENEELRREVEELKSKLEDIKRNGFVTEDYESVKDAFLKVLGEKVREKEGTPFYPELLKALEYLSKALNNPYQFLMQYYQYVVKPIEEKRKAMEEEEMKRKQIWTSQAEINYGGRLW